MAVDVLLGLQWGDEGKGKIVDFIAPKYDIVARFQGGPNAGHTLVMDGIKHVLHQVPSGIFHSHILNIIGNGVVLDPIVFKKEIDGLKAKNVIAQTNLIISKKTQIILPTHRLLDAAWEREKGDNKIGSTLKGIGPAYQDKYARHGLRVADVVAQDFKHKYDSLCSRHKTLLDFYQYDYSTLSDLEQTFFEAIEFLKTFRIEDTEWIINQALEENKSVLAEGAQGSLLDIDFGSYPFVTSSSTMAAGACTGLGVAPKHINKVFGIFKAYCTRVGSGPFPTELHDQDGDDMRKEGNEFGSTTGRPRRCGWLDLPALEYAIRLNGVSELLMMKADVLSIFKQIKIATSYQDADGSSIDRYTHEVGSIGATPVYTDLAGWQTDITGLAENNQALPENLEKYIDFLEKHLKTPITLVSVGPDRKQTCLRQGFQNA